MRPYNVACNQEGGQVDAFAMCVGYAVMVAGGLVAVAGLWWWAVEFTFRRLGWTAMIYRWAAEKAAKRRAPAG